MIISSLSPTLQKSLKFWLYSIAVLIAAMVLVGGATRLTESGLSITEWKPISGVLPPLSSQDWQDAFLKYQQTTEYAVTNRGMSLDDFKSIFWWEWAHRLLGRVIGIAYALPFFFFLLTKKLGRPLAVKLAGVLIFGGMQGVVGWWMVKSGLSGRIDVAPYRLAIHLSLALAIFAYVIALAQNLNQTATRWPLFLKVFIALLFLQIFAGGLVAGARAGYLYNDWPLMNGSFVPQGIFFLKPTWRNFFENAALVQFLHRMIAYTLVSYTLLIFVLRRDKASGVLLGLLCLQICLGISTLMSGMNMALALLHQAGIVAVLAATIVYAQRYATFKA